MTTPEAHLADLTVAELARRIREREVTSVDVVEACLGRIEERDPGLNAFSVVLSDRARAEAADRDRTVGSGEELGPLHGVPVAIKEEIAVEGCVTTFGGRANSTPEAEDGVVVQRLRAAGAVIIGKTRMPEFGAWPYTESVDGGITRNPWEPGHTPGGSSGGTAAAVAAGMVPVGMGGDGGGSIRIPSACCGLFGLKPERGRVTSAPMKDLWFALGTAGPLSRTVLDSALVYDAIRGHVETDTYRAAEPVMSFTEAATSEPKQLRVGWSTAAPVKPWRPAAEHVRAVEETAALLTDLGHDVREVKPHYPDATLAFVPQFFGGIRAEADMVEHYDRLERRIREVYRLGSWVRPGVVRRALRAGEKLSARMDRLFTGSDAIDVLLTPTIAHRPPEVGVLDRGGALTAAYKAQPMIAYTALWNVTGHPAASVPSGVAADGLPLAVQLVGRHSDETTLLSLSAQLESARPWSMPVLS